MNGRIDVCGDFWIIFNKFPVNCEDQSEILDLKKIEICPERNSLTRRSAMIDRRSWAGY